MKKTLFLFAILAVGALSFSSCSSDDDSNGGGATFTTPKYESAAALYEVTESNTMGVRSFVPTPTGRYLLTLAKPLGTRMKDASEPEVLYGTYEFDASAKVYTLSDFGKIKVVSGDEGTHLEITPLEGETFSVAAQLGAMITASSLLNDIARTWKVVRTDFKYQEAGKSAVGAQFTGCDFVEIGNWLKKNHDVDIDADLIAKKALEEVTFTKFGTFTLKFTHGVSTGDFKDLNVSSGKFSYDWTYKPTMGFDYENGNATVKISGKYCNLVLNGGEVTTDKGKKYTGELSLWMEEIK